MLEFTPSHPSPRAVAIAAMARLFCRAGGLRALQSVNTRYDSIQRLEVSSA